MWSPATMRGPEEPPLVATEDEVRVGDAADLGGRAAVAGVGGDGERLRGDQLPEAALGGPALVVVQRVGVVHRLGPAPDVAAGDVVVELPWAHGHAHVAVEVGGVEHGIGRTSGFLRVDGRAAAVERRAVAMAMSTSSRTLASPLVVGSSPAAKNSTMRGTLYRATRSARKAFSTSPSLSAPSAGSTQRVTTSPKRSSGSPTTRARRTAGQARSADLARRVTRWRRRS